MKLAFVRSKVESTVFTRESAGAEQLNAASLEQMKISAKAGSSSKNVISGLQKYGVVTACEEWKFWNGPLQQIALPGQMPVKLFPAKPDLTSDELAKDISSHGQPDILWVEGDEYPPYLDQIFALCPASFKMVYSKNWRPWKVEKLELFDLCLADEEWQCEKVKNLFPSVRSFVWDKLIDYENTHYPLAGEKIYDVCCLAHLRKGKNHELLFHAISRLQHRRIKCVCIGDDRRGLRPDLEKLAADLWLDVHFTGELSKEEVNRCVNQSKIGVMCSVFDAVPRAILEYMAANVPVLVNAEIMAGTRYVSPQSGLVKAPENFHLGLAELLEHYQDYSPRTYYLEHYAFEKIMERFIANLADAGSKLNFEKHGHHVNRDQKKK